MLVTQIKCVMVCTEVLSIIIIRIIPVARQWSYVGNILHIHFLSLTLVIGINKVWNLYLFNHWHWNWCTLIYHLFNLSFTYVFNIKVGWECNKLSVRASALFFIYLYNTLLSPLATSLDYSIPFNAAQTAIQNNHCMVQKSRASKSDC